MQVFKVELKSSLGTHCIQSAQFDNVIDAVGWVVDTMSCGEYGHTPTFSKLHNTLIEHGYFPVKKAGVSYNSRYVFTLSICGYIKNV